MSPEFVRCEFCKVELPSEPCQLAVFKTKIEGEEYVFCCKKCAERYFEKMRGAK